MKSILKTIYKNLPFKKQLFFLLKTLKFPENIYRHLYFEDVFTVKFESYKFLITHYGFQLENEIFWKGLTNGWEKVSMKLWIELSKKSAVILDIGANTGIYSLVSKTVNPTAEVFAFEPVERIYNKLEKNNKLNNYDIHCFELALSDKNGEAIIYDPLTPHVYSVAVNKNISGLDNTTPVTVKTEKLSTFIEKQRLKSISLIKIDVETHEPEVLKGMEHYLELFKPTLLIEILNDEVASQVEDLIRNIDYLYFNIDELQQPRLVKKIRKSDFYNYLLCSEEVARELKLIN
ncbi:MAG: FkbM family methyltransferase [Bacteroidia bacterium]